MVIPNFLPKLKVEFKPSSVVVFHYWPYAVAHDCKTKNIVLYSFAPHSGSQKGAY